MTIMQDKEELESKIQETWGYGDYFQDKYDSFRDYFEDRFVYVSHEEGYSNYETAANALESLVREIYNNQENN